MENRKKSVKKPHQKSKSNTQKTLKAKTVKPDTKPNKVKIPKLTPGIKQVKQGYYKGQFTSLAVKSLYVLEPKLSKKDLAKKLNVSYSTLHRLEQNKKVSKETYKKISQGIDRGYKNRPDKMIQLVKTINHLKHYKTISEKKKKQIIKDSKKSGERLRKNLKEIKKSEKKTKDKRWVLFRIIYGSMKGTGK